MAWRTYPSRIHSDAVCHSSWMISVESLRSRPFESEQTFGDGFGARVDRRQWRFECFLAHCSGSFPWDDLWSVFQILCQNSQIIQAGTSTQMVRYGETA